VDGTTPEKKVWISDPNAWADALLLMRQDQRALMIDMIDLFSIRKNDPQGNQIVVSDSYLRPLANWVGPECFTQKSFQGPEPASHCRVRAHFLKRAWEQPWFQPFHQSDENLTNEDVKRMGFVMATLPGPSTLKGLSQRKYAIKLYYLTKRPEQPINIVLVNLADDGKLRIPEAIAADMSDESKQALGDFVMYQQRKDGTSAVVVHDIRKLLQLTAASNKYTTVYKTLTTLLNPDTCGKKLNPQLVEISRPLFQSLGIETVFQHLLDRYYTEHDFFSTAFCNRIFKELLLLYNDPFTWDKQERDSVGSGYADGYTDGNRTGFLKEGDDI